MPLRNQTKNKLGNSFLLLLFVVGVVVASHSPTTVREQQAKKVERIEAKPCSAVLSEENRTFNCVHSGVHVYG